MKKSYLLIMGMMIVFFVWGCSTATVDEVLVERKVDDLGKVSELVKYKENVDFSESSRTRYEELRIFEYRISLELKDAFDELSIDEQFTIMRDSVYELGKRDFFACSEEDFFIRCQFSLIEFNTTDNRYSMRVTSDGISPLEIVVNSEDRYRPERTTTTTSTPASSENQDYNTFIDDMNGSAWMNLTENQKFHSISNALYALDNDGFTISESEFFFIEALEAFYSDSSTLSVPVPRALSEIGVMSGAISR